MQRLPSTQLAAWEMYFEKSQVGRKGLGWHLLLQWVAFGVAGKRQEGFWSPRQVKTSRALVAVSLLLIARILS